MNQQSNSGTNPNNPGAIPNQKPGPKPPDNLLQLLQQQREAGLATPISDRPYVPDQGLGRLNFDPLNKYDKGLRTDLDHDRLRYLNQNNWQAWGNALVQSVAEVGLGTVEGVSILLDLPQLFHTLTFSEKEFSNVLADLMRSAKESVRENMPVYDSGEEFSASSLLEGRFWAKNLPSITSTLSLAIPTVGAVKGLEGAAKLSRLNKTFKLTKDGVKGARGLTGAITSRYMENTLEAVEALESKYQEYLNLGFTEEQAREKAGDAAANVYYANWVNLITDIPQYSRLFRKGSKAIDAVEDAALRKAKESTLKDVLKTMFGEGLEEGIQYGIQNVSGESSNPLETIVNVLAKSPQLIQEREFWESFTLGAVGGGLFAGGGPAVKKLTEAFINKTGNALNSFTILDDKTKVGQSINRNNILHSLGDKTLTQVAEQEDDPELAQAARDIQELRSTLTPEQQQAHIIQQNRNLAIQQVNTVANGISILGQEEGVTLDDIKGAVFADLISQSNAEIKNPFSTNEKVDLSKVDQVQLSKLKNEIAQYIKNEESVIAAQQKASQGNQEQSQTQTEEIDDEKDVRFSSAGKLESTVAEGEGVLIEYNGKKYIAKPNPVNKHVHLLYDPETGKSSGLNILSKKIGGPEAKIIQKETTSNVASTPNTSETINPPIVKDERVNEKVNEEVIEEVTEEKDNTPQTTKQTVKGLVGNHKNKTFEVSDGPNEYSKTLTDTETGKKFIVSAKKLGNGEVGKEYQYISESGNKKNVESSQDKNKSLKKKPEPLSDEELERQGKSFIDLLDETDQANKDSDLIEVTPPPSTPQEVVEEDDRKYQSSIASKILGLFYVSPKGKIDESKKELLDPDLTKIGTEVTLEIANDDSMSYGSTTWGEVKKKLSQEEIIEQVPIKIYAGNKFLGYLPTTAWVENKYGEQAPDAVTKSKNIREHLFKVKKAKAKIAHRTDGHLFKTENKSVRENLPKGKLLVKNALSIEMEEGTQIPANISSVEMTRTYIVLEVNNVTRAYSVDESKLLDEEKNGIYTALMLYHKVLLKQPFTAQEQERYNEFKKVGYDFKNPIDVTSYIRLFSYTVSKASPFYHTTSPHIQVTSKGIYFDTDKGVRKSLTGKGKVDAASIKDLVDRMYTSSNVELFNRKQLVFPVIKDGKVVTYKKDYVEAIRDRTLTKITGIELESGKTVYYTNPNVYLNIDDILQSEKVEFGLVEKEKASEKTSETSNVEKSKISNRLDELNKKVKALRLKFINTIRQLNAAYMVQVIAGEDVPNGVEELLNEYSEYMSAVNSLTDETEISNLDDESFSAWVKANDVQRNDVGIIGREEDAPLAAKRVRILRNRGDNTQADKELKYLKNSIKKEDWTIETYKDRFNEELTQDRIDVVNSQNKIFNIEVNKALSTLNDSTTDTSDSKKSEEPKKEVKLSAFAQRILDANKGNKELGYPPVFIPGMNTKEMFEIVQLIANELFSNLMSDSKFTGKDVREFMNQRKEDFTNLTNPDLGLSTHQIENLKKAISNWGTIENLVKLYMSKRNNVSFKGDMDIEDLLDEQGEDNVRIDFSDDYSFTIDFRNTITGELKRLLSQIPTKQSNFLNLTSYESLDIVYNTLSSLLVMDTGENEVATWERTREKIVEANLPFDILNLLDKSSESVKNQFVALFNKHYLNMSFLMWQENKNQDGIVTGYSFFPTESSRNGIRFHVQDQWESMSRATNNLDAVLLAIKAKESPKMIFEKLGIVVSDATINLLNRPIKFAGKLSTGLKWHYSEGVFKQLEERIKEVQKNPTEQIWDQSILKAFINLEAKSRPNMYNTSFASGNMIISGFANPRSVINRLSQLKREEVRNRLKKLPFSKMSIYLLNWINENVKYEYVDISNALKKRNTKSTLKRRLSELSPAEVEEFKVNMFLNSGSNTARFVYPTMSDKTFALMLTFEKERVNYDTLFEQVVVPELLRMKYAQEGFSDNYNPNLFYFIPSLNESSIKEKLLYLLPYLNEDGKITGANTEIIEDIKKELEKILDNLAAKKEASWNKHKVKFDSKSFRNQFETKLELAKLYEFNYMIFNANMHMLFIGDPAIYYKSKPSKPLIEQVWDTFINIGKRLAGDSAPRISQTLDKDSNIRYIVLKDIYGISKNIKDITLKLDGKEISDKEVKEIEEALNTDKQKEVVNKYKKLYPQSAAYFEINTTDAQEYTTKDEHVRVLRKYGKISDAERDYLLSKDEFTEEEVGEYFTPLLAQKPIYVGNHVVNETIDQRFYIKSSSIPLLPQLTEGTPLDKLRVYMEKNKVDRAPYESAVKVGGKNPVTLDTLDSATHIDLPRENFGIQLELPFDPDKDEVKRGTQESKLLFTNLLKHFSKKKKQYDEYYKNIMDLKREEFKKEFYTEDGRLDIEKIGQILQNEALQRGYSYFEILALKLVSGQFKFPLFTISPRIESLLLSIIGKRLGGIKFPGKSYVLISEAMLQGRSKGVTYTKDWKGYLGSNEVLLPWIFKDVNINNYKNEDGTLNLDKIPEDLLKLVGFRIPTQGINSMSSIKIVGFLPAAYQDIIIASQDLIVQMGSDFDIDKLITYHYNYTVKEDGTIVKSKEFGTEDHYVNRLIDIHHDVLNSEEAKPLLYKPLDYGKFPDIITSEVDEEFVPLSEQYQTMKFINARAGKAGVGVFSLDSVFNAIIQGKGLALRDFSLTFGDRTWNGEFDDINEKRTPYEIISAYQSASVDNEKEQILDKVDINKFTFPVARVLNAASFEEDVAKAFLTQPIVLRYVELRWEELSHSEAVEKLEKEYRINNEKNSLTDEQLKLADVDVAKLEEYKKNIDVLQQRAILYKLDKLVDAGETIGFVQTTLNTDSAGLPKNGIAVNSKFNKLKTISAKIKNAYNVLGKTSDEQLDGYGLISRQRKGDFGIKSTYFSPEGIPGLYARMLSDARDIIDILFPIYRSVSLNQLFTQLELQEKRELTDNEKDTVKKEFISYLYTGYYQNANKYRQELLNTLGIEILNLQKISQNLFIQKLKVKYDEGEYLVEYNAAAREDFDDIMVVAAFEEIMQEYPKLGRKLIDYHYLTSGQQQAREYIKYVDPDHAQFMSDYINSLDFNNLNVNEFVKQYTKKNLKYYTATNLAPEVKDVKVTPGNKKLREALFDLYNNSKDQETKYLAELLLPYIDNQTVYINVEKNLKTKGRLTPGKVEVQDNGTLVFSYDPYQFKSDEHANKVLLHELFHVVTTLGLKSNLSSAIKIEELFEKFKKVAVPTTTQQKYMLSSIDEFVTMFMSDKEYRDWVDSYKLGGSKTYKNEFIQMLSDLFNEILNFFGFQSKFSKELFAEVINLMDEYGKLVNKDQGLNSNFVSNLKELSKDSHKNC